MFGKLEHELEMHVPAREVWDLFGTLRIGQFVEQEMTELFQKVELIEGDGGVGTVLKLTFAPGHLYLLLIHILYDISACFENLSVIDYETKINFGVRKHFSD